MNAVRSTLVLAVTRRECYPLSFLTSHRFTTGKSSHSSLHGKSYLNATRTIPVSGSNLSTASHDFESHNDDGYRIRPGVALVGCSFLATLCYYWHSRGDWKVHGKEEGSVASYEPGSVVKGKPTYTASEVQKHNSVQNRVWVCECGRVIICQCQS